MSGLTSLSSTLTSAVNQTQANINTTQTQLASDKKILDPAQQGVVTRLTAQVEGYNAVKSNITQTQSVVSVAQTGLSAISDMLTQMQSMASKASTAGVTAADRASYQATFASLATQVKNLATSASVNGANLLTAVAGVDVQTGLDGTAASQTNVPGIDISATGLPSLDVAVDISTVAGAQAAIDLIKTDLATVSAGQSSLTASAVGLSTQSTMADGLKINLQNTIDSIQKPDQAALQIKLTQLNNQSTVNFYLISQMNTASQAVLSLFR